jgi:hypothetical protein
MSNVGTLYSVITFLLATTQPPDRVPGYFIFPRNHHVHALIPKLKAKSSLDDRKQVLSIFFA